MAKFRSLDLLPEIFNTPANASFLSATLDQLVNDPNVTKVQGYVGSKFGSGIDATDNYVVEPDKIRTDYQLTPGVIFTNNEDSSVRDFITYPGLNDSLEIHGSTVKNANTLYGSEIYSWDSFADLDKLVNYTEYYWLPVGPPSVKVATETVYTEEDYTVTSYSNAYGISATSASQGLPTNPAITLLRGGSYRFNVNQDSNFWIQTQPGTSGTDNLNHNTPTREIYGVINNGVENGILEFNVPNKNAQDDYDFPGDHRVDVVCTVPFNEINATLLRDFADNYSGQVFPGVNNIDGLTDLDGLRVLFYNTGVLGEVGYVSSYYDEANYDINGLLPAPVTEFADSVSSNAIILSGSSTTDGWYVNQTVTFVNPIGGLTTGQVYFIQAIIDDKTFTVSETLDGTPITLLNDSGNMTVQVYQGLYQDGFDTVVNDNFYRITIVGSSENPILRLIPDGTIPINERITPDYGNTWIGRGFYKNELGVISLIPQITANLDVLYYQDGTNPNKVGVIRLVDSNADSLINVDTQILGRKSYTSPNGVKFTNGLKIIFDGNVYPTEYLNGEYYVEGVGTSIELVPVANLQCPEKFTIGEYIPYDTSSYDTKKYDIDLNIPVEQDYITVARNAINRNAWSRSNRWFHIDAITASAEYNLNTDILTQYATNDAKAKRPIIEFYPNLKLMDTGNVGKNTVDFFDTRETDALSNVSGLYNYYPDVETYTKSTAVIDANSTTPVNAGSFIVGNSYVIDTVGDTDWNTVVGTSGYTYVTGQVIIIANTGAGTGTAIPLSNGTSITVPTTDISGTFQIGMFVGDSDDILPVNTRISNITISGDNTILDVSWETPANCTGGTTSIVGTDTTVSNYSLFPGARIVFANDADPQVVGKIFVVDFSKVNPSDKPTIVLTLADDGNNELNSQIAIGRGYNYQGKSYYFDGSWNLAQQKVTVNQAPLFDVFDKNGTSFSDSDVYNSTSFHGCTLLSYGIGSGYDDPILGFPVRYSSVDNIGDISFDVSLNIDSFSYVVGFEPITERVNTGFVYSYQHDGSFKRLLGWEATVEESVQYQLFSFDFDPATNFPDLATGHYSVECDIPVKDGILYGEKGWPRVKVYINNQYQTEDQYIVTINNDSTLISLVNVPEDKTVIQVALLSDKTSQSAYYEIPVNLNNNPMNDDLTVANLGDIRLHYSEMFINAPDTEGSMFGRNNFHDCGNMVSYGTRIIKNSAPVVLPGVFARNPDVNFFDALLFNSREYVKFKQLLLNTVINGDYSQHYTPDVILDDALDQISATKTEEGAFFWSDMLPNKSAIKTQTYNYNSSQVEPYYPLSRVYDFSSANYYGILVYLNRSINGNVVRQLLVKDLDYVVSDEISYVTIKKALLPNDTITIKEYDQTYGSFVPNTPTKLGLFPSYEPKVVLDKNFIQPTYFILGHDGSYTKLFGDYDSVNEILVDFRDQVTLEFERRIYNNLKLGGREVFDPRTIEPGFFRDSLVDWNTWNTMYSTSFLNWAGQNRVDYKTQTFNRNNEWTYNYTNSTVRLDNSPVKQGHWRGLYQYLFDTTSPDTSPWELLGFSNKPSWWDEHYGPAPYTKDNSILWSELEQGVVWNNGDSFVEQNAIRPGLSEIIPVDSEGNLATPLSTVIGTYNPSTFQKDWVIGDMGPVELSYRRSSTWAFDLVRLYALIIPAKFYNLAVDFDHYRYNEEFNQYLVDGRSHLKVDNIDIYGSGTPKTSYINWVVDYQKQHGINATEEIGTLLGNLDVRLVYRLAGFSDKSMMNFYVEKGSPNGTTASLLIPNESYQVLLYNNQPDERLIFSSVIVQKKSNGWSVYGNSQNFSYFITKEVNNNSRKQTVTVGTQSVRVSTEHLDNNQLVAYGTVFYSTQDLAQFLMNYAAYLNSSGMKFEFVEDGAEISWMTMIQEFLYWVQTGWQPGSVLNLNPAATDLVVDNGSSIVQPLTIHNQNFILNQNLYPVQTSDICIVRDGTSFKAHTLNSGDSLSYAQFNMGSIEHGIVFDNVTLFNDTIYNLITGLRQNRIVLRGTKSAEWNGTLDASGFILNQDNIEEWNISTKYPKGKIVKHKNRYWAAQVIVEPSSTFDDNKWKRIEYSDVQKGLLPNSSTRAFESTLYYDSNKGNLDSDSDRLSFSLIGYRPRDYLQLADLTDITQVNVYKDLIKNKGTNNALNIFKGAELPQGSIDYDIHENWAILTGEYGGTMNDNFVEFRLDEHLLTGNPAIVSLTDGSFTPGVMQEVQLNNLYNYGEQVTNPNILSTLEPGTENYLYPTAGYVNFNDVRMSSFNYSSMNSAVDQNNSIVDISDFYVGDYAWLADYNSNWNVFTWKPVGEINKVTNNINGTVTISFAQPHGLSKDDPFAIINFADNVNGYYKVQTVQNLNQIVVNKTILNAGPTETIVGNGLVLKFVSQRVAAGPDIAKLPLNDTEFRGNTVWVDEDIDGSWAVYRKSTTYKNTGTITNPTSYGFGEAVAYSPEFGYLVSDPTVGTVYRYDENHNITQYLGQAVTFGTKIIHRGNLVFISQPAGILNQAKLFVYVKNNSTQTDDLELVQTIVGGTATWGTSFDVSGDGNWIFVTDSDTLSCSVYRRGENQYNAGYFESGQTYVINELGTTDFTLIGAVENKVGITFVSSGLGSGTGKATKVTYNLVNEWTEFDYLDFGYDIATDYYGRTLVISAPGTDYDTLIQDWGKVVVYDRPVQNIEVQVPNVVGTWQDFKLLLNPGMVSSTLVTDTTSGTNRITLGDASDINVDQAIVFRGPDFNNCGIQENKVYYVHSVIGSDIVIKENRSSSIPVDINTATGLGFSAYPQATSYLLSSGDRVMTVSVNGQFVTDNNYAFVDDSFVYVGVLNPGDIISVEIPVLVQNSVLNSNRHDRTGFRFGQSIALNRMGNELLVGSPYEVNEVKEGVVYRFTNIAAKQGVLLGTSACSVSSNITFLVNGFMVHAMSGSGAIDVASAINDMNIPNVQASNINDRLLVQVIDKSISEVNRELVINVSDESHWAMLGLTVLTNSQVISSPATGPTGFGSDISFNEFNSVAISAPMATRFEGTLFDFVDENDLHLNTVFDNNSTEFVDSYQNVGSTYVFDLIGSGQDGNYGKFVYGQSAFSLTTDNCSGTSLDFGNNKLVIADRFSDGEVTIFDNETGINNWSVYRKSSEIVDINRIQNCQLFDSRTNETLTNLDYFDPLQGKLLGVVREGINYVSSEDPAGYNSDQVAFNGFIWGSDHVGKTWLDTSTLRFVNYHQDDVEYNVRYWGALFPGSDPTIYTWISSDVTPDQYSGEGTPKDMISYTVSSRMTSSNVVVPVYYYWVRHPGVVTENKLFPESVLETYLLNPRTSGISYFEPVLPNVFAIYNSEEFIHATDTVFHLGYANGKSDDVSHREFTLIREGHPDDFLPGVPNTGSVNTLTKHYMYPVAGQNLPTDLYAKFLDSLSGCDTSGSVVPNPFLPKIVQSGVSIRPGQSMFSDRSEALKNYLLYANDILKQYPITELRPDLTLLGKVGEYYDTTRYWEYINWWAEGYNDSTRVSFQVEKQSDLNTLQVAPGTLVKVEKNGSGAFEVYILESEGIWSRIGLENGTIQFKHYLWDYDDAKIGYGGDFFDTSPYDSFPSEETRNIVRALTEQIYTGDLGVYRNRSLIILFEYIEAESNKTNQFLPWLNKTSLVDVNHSVRELKPYSVYKSDNSEFLAGYINETKPYHVVIKEFLFKYTGIEDYAIDVTDFDIPAQWNEQYGRYISPQLTSGSSNSQQGLYGLNDDIWQESQYRNWYGNRGLSLTGMDNYNITTLRSYIDMGSTFMIVDNAAGFPNTGTIRVDNELITYTYVDPSRNLVGGFLRGVDNTLIEPHYPDTRIYIDIPPVVVLNSGRGYTDIPKINVIVPAGYPEPIEPAELRAVMNIDSVISVEVLNPGKGYLTAPEIEIEPAYELSFNGSMINSTLHTISLYAPILRTGDIVRFESESQVEIPNKLVNGQWYYVGVLETSPNTIIGLYDSYRDAVNDINRIQIGSNGNSATLKLLPGAKASLVTSSRPVRSMNTRLKFDRTTYTSQVLDWEADSYYGSYFAGNYYDKNAMASTSIKLQSTNPDINEIRASAQGAVFEISKVDNEQTTEWSSFVRKISVTESSNNSISLIPQDGNNPDLSELEDNASGTTNGFYEGMPIQFRGFVIGGLQENVTYYIKEVISELEFSVSNTENGPEVTLTDGSTGLQTLECRVGKLLNTAIVTLNYPGILEVSKTESVSNAITIPLHASGTGGTKNIYVNLPVFFTGSVFGGILENEMYYVNTVIDKQRFTISEKTDPVVTQVLGTDSVTNQIVVESTRGFDYNDPIIFTKASDDLTTAGIESGVVYYVQSVVNNGRMVISTSFNGSPHVVTTSSGTAQVDNQKDALPLTSSNGSMTVHVSLPVSPGQINGKEFQFYGTSGQYVNVATAGISKLITRNITSIIGTNFSTPVNRITYSGLNGDTTNFYVNMPVRFDDSVGGLISGTTYYITEYSGGNSGHSDTSVNVTGTSSIGNILTCNSTAVLYEGMPITFSGIGLGGIVVDEVYFVNDIISSTTFTISDVQFGTDRDLTTASGLMVGIGDPYIKVSTSIGGLPESLTTTSVSFVNFEQFITDIPTFNVSYMLGGYQAYPNISGSGFSVNNTMIIPGSSVGGISPKNDITLTVNSIGPEGEIIDVICSGTVPYNSNNYYLEVRSPNQMAVYANAAKTVPLSGLEFEYVGITALTVNSVDSSNDSFIVDDTSLLNVNDKIAFTGDTIDEVDLGTTYYVYQILSSTEFTVTKVLGDVSELVEISSTRSTDFVVGKSGSFAFLPEPFYFTQSIVKFNNRLYVCVVSNNDSEFVLGKWELIDSNDPRLNALDRTVGYYQPTSSMPGNDLTQLFDGVTFPYATYKGNVFSPDDQYEVDTDLTDLPFETVSASIESIQFNGTSYIAIANLPGYNAVLIENSGNWDFEKITSSNLNVTDLKYNNGLYVMTSTNVATPILRSNNGTSWSTEGYYQSNGISALALNQMSLNSVCYGNGIWVAVGDRIVRSSDSYTWIETHTFNSALHYELRSVHYSSALDGFVATGRGMRVKMEYGVDVLVPTDIIFFSDSTGETWTEVASLTDSSLNSVFGNSGKVISVGDNGVIYYSENGADWLGVNEVGCISVNSSTDQLNIANSSGLVVDDQVVFNQDFSSIVAGTTYYVKTIDSSTQITLSDTLGGSTKTLPATNPISGQVLLRRENEPHDNLNDVTYAYGIWMAVGDNGVVRTSVDNGFIWKTLDLGTNSNLNSVVFNSVTNEFMIVGDNNTILTSKLYELPITVDSTIVTVDSGITVDQEIVDELEWSSQSVIIETPADYHVKGAEFTYGYGPEELIPGNVKDGLVLKVNTRPGSSWSVEQFGHMGFNVVSEIIETVTDGQLIYSFDGLVQNPAQIKVQVIDGVTGLAHTIYPNIDYIINWLNKTVILISPLETYPVKDKLLVDVYEVGNGDQLVKSSTDDNVIRSNSQSGFNEIYLNCNYSEELAFGSGVIRPETSSIDVTVIETISGTNQIICESVKQFTLGSAITFLGVTFGGIIEEQVYFVKTISAVTNSITVSLSFDMVTGTPGPAVDLTNATGTMYAAVQNGNGQVWSPPYVYHNGTKLIHGATGLITKTSSVNNAITTNTTSGLTVGTRISFCACVFGMLNPFTTYYIAEIIDGNEFSISETNGGPVVPLIDSTGGSTFVTNDFAFGQQPNGISAKMIFPINTYTNENDYIVYSVFGETQPEQYGYSIPETQYFVGDGTTDEFGLTNYLDVSNATNAIVEINGLRLTDSDYNIDQNTQIISFVSAPGNGDNIAVTTYNDTRNQYLNSQFNVSGVVSPVSSISNTLTTPLAQVWTTSTSASGNIITVSSPGTTDNFVVGQFVQFYGTGFGNILTDGTVYLVETIPDSTTFTISDLDGNTITLANGSGYMDIVVGGQSTVRMTTSVPHGFVTNDLVRIDGTVGSIQLNNNTFFVKVVTPTVIDLYLSTYTASLSGNSPVTQVSTYIDSGFVWKDGSFTVYSATSSESSSIGNVITVDSTSLLISGTPVYFNKDDGLNGDDILGGIIQGTKYYVKDILSSSTFTISSVQYGDEFILDDETATVRVSQWEQINTDRLYITINGFRVPSENIKLNSVDRLSILAQIESGDEVIITSMIPTATMNEVSTLVIVDTDENASVYNINSEYRSWLTQPLTDLDTEIHVSNVNALVNTIVQDEIVGTVIDGEYSLGIDANKRMVTSVTVFNVTKNIQIADSDITLVLDKIAPSITIKDGPYISSGDEVRITTLEGNMVYINGEFIRYSKIDIANNTLSGIYRGVNNTGVKLIVPTDTLVFGIMDSNKLPDQYYFEEWDSFGNSFPTEFLGSNS